MQDHQAITLQSYREHFQEFIDHTSRVVLGTQKSWLDELNNLLQPGASILEIGSGSGRDADYLETLGRHVYRTDAVEGFVNYQITQGHKAHVYDVLSGPFTSKFYAVLASQVFSHFDPEQFARAVANIYISTQPQGYFALSLKLGEGYEYSVEKLNSPLFFQYWTTDSAAAALVSGGFDIVSSKLSDEHDWVHIIGRKKV